MGPTPFPNLEGNGNGNINIKIGAKGSLLTGFKNYSE